MVYQFDPDMMYLYNKTARTYWPSVRKLLRIIIFMFAGRVGLALTK